MERPTDPPAEPMSEPARQPLAVPRDSGVDRVLRVAMTLEQCWHRVPGGTATSVLGLIGALVRRPDVDVVGLAARHRTPPPQDLAPPVPVRHLRWPQRPLYLAWSGGRFPSVDRAAPEADIVHATAVAVPPTSAPLVVTVHDLAFLDHPERATRWGRIFFERGLALTRARARLVTCPSQTTAAECRAAGIDPARLRVVPWGLDWPVAADAEVEEVRARLGLPDRFVLWVGTMEPRKNLPGLLEAHRLVGRRSRSQVPLVLVGPLGWNQDLPSEADGVRVMGRIGHDDLPAVYRAATVMCYPSLQEGFGLPVLEAMSQGTPVVTSSGTATAEVAGETGLLADPTDPRAVADAVAAVWLDPAAACELGRAGLRRAGTMTWDATAAAMARVYREAHDDPLGEDRR